MERKFVEALRENCWLDAPPKKDNEI